jgi:hypothetical protein
VDQQTLASRQRLAMVCLGVALAAIVLIAGTAGAEPWSADGFGSGQDARAYWEAARAAPYGSDVGSQSAYLYSPAFLQLIAPLTSLSWQPFLGSWIALLIGATFLLAGPLLMAPVVLLASFEIWGANITLLLALAIVAGFRWPAAWAFVLLTKVAPGIGLLWFVVRREWRSLAIALGATAIVAAISWLLAPDLWADWIAVLIGGLGRSTPDGAIQLPLWLRLPAAAALTAYAGLTDRRWLVPVAAMLALPVLWFGGLSMLVGVVALRRAELEAALMRVLTSAPHRQATRLTRQPVPRS